MVSLSKGHTTTIAMEGHPVQVRLARLTFEQAEAHRRVMNTIYQKTRRQQRELAGYETRTPEDLAAIQARHAAEDVETEALVRAAIEAYVTVDPHQIAVDGHEILTGKDLLDAFGDDVDLLMRVMQAIERGSRVSAATGKASGSPSDSTRSSGASDASGPEAPGPRPEASAGAADGPDTTPSVAATEAMDRPSSGPMAA